MMNKAVKGTRGRGRWAAALLAGLLLLLLTGCGPREVLVDTSAGAGESVAGISTTDLSGDPVDGTVFTGNTLTVLNIWTTWCSPCVEELPELQRIDEDYAAKGVRVVGVLDDGVDDKLQVDEKAVAAGQTLLADAGAGYTVILPDGILREKLISGIQGYPTTFFIDSDGEVVHMELGSRDYKNWSVVVDEVLAELG